MRVTRRGVRSGGAHAGGAGRGDERALRATATRRGRWRGRRTTSRACGRCSRRHSSCRRRVAELLPRLREHRGPADRLLGLRHEGVVGARGVRRAARRGSCRSCARSRRAPLADDRCLPQASSRGRAARVRARGDPRVRLRLRARPPGQDASSVHDQVLARRRAHHHPRARERHHRRAVQHAAREPATRCTSRAFARELEGTPLATARRRASTRASRACGRTSSAAAAASGSTSSRRCRPRSRSSWRTCRSTRSIVRSTRWRAR